MPLPETRIEHYLDALLNDTDCPHYPEQTRSRIENYLDALCHKGGGDYAAGKGITIDGNTISITQEVVLNYNVETVGDPTIDNLGNMSGFSIEDYAQYPEVFEPGLDNWSMDLRVITGANTTTPQAIIGNYDNGIFDCPELKIDNGVFTLRIPYVDGTHSETVQGLIDVEPNTTYDLILSCNAEGAPVFSLRVSKNGGDYADDIIINAPHYMDSANGKFAFGVDNAYEGSQPFGGTIVFTGAQMSVGEEVVWHGIDVVEDNIAKASDTEWGLVRGDGETVEIIDGTIGVDFSTVASVNYVDEKVGNIDTALAALISGGGAQ